MSDGIGMSDRYLGTAKQGQSETYSYNSKAFMHLIPGWVTQDCIVMNFLDCPKYFNFGAVDFSYFTYDYAPLCCCIFSYFLLTYDFVV